MKHTPPVNVCQPPESTCAAPLETMPRPARRDYFPTKPRRSGQSHRYLAQDPTTGTWWPANLHADSKVSPSVIFEANGRATATVGNAWILPVGDPRHGGTCSSTTTDCQSCYAASLEAAYHALARMAEENLDSLRQVAQHGVANLAAWLTAIVEASVAEQTAQGVQRPAFRWHSGGDLGALVGTGRPRHDYPRAIRAAAKATPHVQHWIYTRELWSLGSLKGAPNLRVLVSVDRDNWRQGCAAAARHGMPVALLADHPDHAQQMWQQIRTEWPNLAPNLLCPATGRWKHDQRGPAHITGPDGRRSTLERGSTAVGACIACQACLPNAAPRSVTFHMHNPGQRLQAAYRRRSIPVSAG